MPSDACKYFLAIVPDQPIYDQIHSLKLYVKEAFQSKASLNSPPHITLHMPFEWKETKEEKLIAALKKFTAGRKSVEIQLQDFSCFAPRVIFVNVIESEPLHALQAELQKFCKTKLNLFNARYRDLPFHPHITLAFRDLKKELFEKAWAEFKERKLTARFMASKITLLKHDGKIWKPYLDFDF